MFLKKKSKDKKFDILHYRNCLFLVCTVNDNISRGCDKNGISRGKGGPFCEPILENPDGSGGIGKISSVVGLWIFSG